VTFERLCATGAFLLVVTLAARGAEQRTEFSTGQSQAQSPALSAPLVC
jgi:hypothetical protein